MITDMVDDEVVAAWVARLRAAAETGEPLDLAAGLAPESTDRNPANAEAWGTERQLPAAALRAVLIDRDLVVDPHGIRINGARITGPVDLENVQFKYPLHLTASRVEHDIDLSGSTLSELNLAGSHVNSLNLNRTTITFGLFACDKFTAEGEVFAAGASIGGQFVLDGASLTNPGGFALDLGDATITGGLFANKFTAEGQVRASGASIGGGPLELDGATLTNPGGFALDLSGATVTFGLFARDKFTAEGQVRALRASIGGPLELDGATLTNPGGIALLLEGATVTGGLYARDKFTAEGQVRAFGASIGGPLELDGATLTNPGGIALDLQRATIATLRLTPASVDGMINLTRATITDLITPENSISPGQLVATGWQVTDMHGLIRTNRVAARRWLNTTPGWCGFTVQPWHALAAVYDRNGQPADARRLRFLAANKITKHAPWYSKPLRWTYLVVAGHGYYPLLAALWLAGVLALGVLIVDNNPEHFVPADVTSADKAATTHAAENHTTAPDPITAADSCAVYADYPCFNSFNYALAGVVPSATGALKADWTISSTAPAVLAFGLPALRIIAWIFTAILLAGVTGLLRKT